MINAQQTGNTDNLPDRPSDELLREMASQSKMTFARMARELAVDRKTIRRWCRDAGIEKCGVKRDDGSQGVGVTQLGETVAAIPPVEENDKTETETPGMVTDLPQPVTDKPEADTPIPAGEDLLQTIQARQAWLTEFLVGIHERLLVIERGISGVACQLPTSGGVKGLSSERSLYTMIMHIAAKIEAMEMLDVDEQDLYSDLATICRSSMAEDLARLKLLIDKHYHVVMSVDSSKAFSQERRARIDENTFRSSRP